MKQSTLGLALRYGLLSFLAVLVLLPFVGIALAALHPSGSQVSGVALPERWSWENFSLAWEAGGFDDLMRINLPISLPAATTLTVLVFMWSWNQFLLVLVMMQDPTMRTAPTGLGLFVGQYGTDIPLLAAASLIVIAPIVVVYLVFQRSFVSGITQGAIKG